jgi:hypothetical protein
MTRASLAHIDAWSRHDWDKTRELLAPNVHATVTTTQPGFRDAELTGVDSYMEQKNLIDESGKIREERGTFFVLSQ